MFFDSLILKSNLAKQVKQFNFWGDKNSQTPLVCSEYPWLQLFRSFFNSEIQRLDLLEI